MNNSNDPQQDYFADGMMDEILNHLFKIGDLRIISRTSAMGYKGTRKSIKEIARELGVANLLEGSVQKEGQRIRIRVQLIDGKTDEHLWAETYERELKDIFAIQSDIAQSVASQLKIKIDPSVKERMEFKPTENLEAYSLYLRAINTNVVEDNYLPKRRAMLETVIALDSTFADAYAELAKFWLWDGGHAGTLKAEEALQNAQPLLQKALRLNPDLAIGYLYSGSMHLWFNWDFAKAKSAYEKALQLNPSNVEISNYLAEFLFAQGKFNEGFAVAINAFKKDSSLYNSRISLALGYYYTNNPGKALQTIEPIVKLFPNNYWVWVNSIRIKTYAAAYKEATLEFEKKAQEEIIPNMVLGYAAVAYYKTGKKDSTEKFLNAIKERAAKSPTGAPSFYIAIVYAAMEKNDLAIQWLEKAYRDHEVETFHLKAEPLFRPLRNDARFQNIVNRIGYPE
jgi:TolB-like protein/Tfp pilus assembly protein PilF